MSNPAFMSVCFEGVQVFFMKIKVIFFCGYEMGKLSFIAFFAVGKERWSAGLGAKRRRRTAIPARLPPTRLPRHC